MTKYLNVRTATVFIEIHAPRARVYEVPTVSILYSLSTGSVIGEALYGLESSSDVAVITVPRSSIPEYAWQIQHTIYVDTSVTPHEVKLCMTPTWTPSKATIVANGVDASVLTGIPAGAEVRISDKSGCALMLADGTALSITSIVPDTIEIVVIHQQYTVDVFIVEAT
jgi:hypothetical protein